MSAVGLSGVRRLLVGAVVSLPAVGTLMPLGPASILHAQAGAGDVQELAAARKAFAAGQMDEALKTANAVLLRNPASREAIQLKLNVLLSRQQFTDAFAAYDAYVVSLRKPDQEVLRVIAVADLRRIVRDRQNDSMMVTAALERLARSGDAEALRVLKQMAAAASSASPEGLAPALSLARLADPEARANLGKLLDLALPDGRVLLIKTIQDAGATAQAPAIAARLDDPEPSVRSAAALALGVLQYRAAIPRLQAAFQGDVPIVRMNAALALKRLGDTSVDTFVAQLLKSEIPDVRLMAAEAFQGTRSQEWLTLVGALRADQNDVNRIRAATVMACCEPATARAILLDSFSSAIPLVRLDAARALEATGLGDAALARRMLGDSFDPVRMSGAGIAIAPVRPMR